MKNPHYRHSHPLQQPSRFDVLASPPFLHPKGENKSYKEAAALSICCILGDWVHLIRLYFNFEIWCSEYRKTYRSVKEKLYRFGVFKKTFEKRALMPNAFGDQTEH